MFLFRKCYGWEVDKKLKMFRLNEQETLIPLKRLSWELRTCYLHNDKKPTIFWYCKIILKLKKPDSLNRSSFYKIRLFAWSRWEEDSLVLRWTIIRFFHYRFLFFFGKSSKLSTHYYLKIQMQITFSHRSTKNFFFETKSEKLYLRGKGERNQN